MADLEDKLKAAGDARLRLIFSDGIFSMEGDIAKLPDIVTLARKYDAVVALDDSHATGVLGRTGRGTAEHHGMLGEIDVITSTLGKALGGAAGGFTAGARGRGGGGAGGCLPGGPRAPERLPHPALAPAAVQQRAAAHGGRERPRGGAPPRASPRVGTAPARERALLPGATGGARIPAASRRNAHPACDSGRNGPSDPD